MTTLTVIVPTIYPHHELRQQLDALHRCSGMSQTDFVVTFVDDSHAESSDLERVVSDWSAASGIGARVLRNRVPHGFTHAVNHAMRSVHTPFAVLLNSDAFPMGNCLDQLVLPMVIDRNTAVVGGMLLDPGGSVQELGCWITREAAAGQSFAGRGVVEALEAGLRAADYSSAALLAVRMTVWRELGGFDLRFAPAYFEDSDFCVRVWSAGYSVVVNPLATAFHIGGVSFGERKNELMNSGARAFREKWREEAWPLPVREGPHRQGGPLNVLMVDWDVPAPDRDSGSRRGFELIRAIRRGGAHVDFIPASGNDRGVYGLALESMGVKVRSNSQQVLDELMRKADVVWVARPNAYRWIVKNASMQPDFLVYDMVDHHLVRLVREAEHSSGASRTPEDELDLDAEAQALLAASIVIAVSHSEAFEASTRGARVVRVVGNIHGDAQNVGRDGGCDGLRCLFIGSQMHSPNVDALHWLLNDIWPRVRRVLPQAELVVAGMESSAGLSDSQAGVRILGWLRDARDAYAGVCVALAPLRYGAGVKGKVTEAYSLSCPVVGTSIAFEGLPLDGGVECLVAEDADRFVESIAELLLDPTRAQKMGGLGHKRLSATSSLISAGEVVEAILEGVNTASSREST